MKSLLLALLIVLLTEFLLMKCASPKAPTGGPQDTIPPVLITAIPPYGSLNFKEKIIILEFDEFVSAEKLTSNLIITPNIENKYKAFTKKNKLILKFEDFFPANTTITLNFFDGVTDITEKTPAVNLTFTVSTGNYLDSLSITGLVKDLFSQQNKPKITIGLFPFTDSLDLFKSKPTYFTSTSKEGTFNISNIKNGTYKLLAFEDQNRNLQFDASTERYGFIAKPLKLDSTIKDLVIPLIKINALQLRLISSRPLGNHFELRYSKGLKDITIDQSIPYQLQSDNQTFKIFNQQKFDLKDSLLTVVSVTDSLLNISNDTVYVKFNDQVRKSASFDLKITPEKTIDIKSEFTLSFNKPVLSSDVSLLKFAKDSTIVVPIDTSSFQWNINRTNLSFKYEFDTTSYYNKQREIQALNTVTLDSTRQSAKKQSSSVSKNIDLIIPKGAFISVENDSLASTTQSFTFIQSKETGTLLLNINTSFPSYTLQVIDKQFKVLQEYPPSKHIKVSNLSPMEYGIRILIDDNEDGKWSHGNLLLNQEPESVYLYPDFTTLRANWEITLDISF